jgi:multidrug resistance efflux pump
VWTNGKKRNILYSFAIGWNRRALYPGVYKLRLWDWRQDINAFREELDLTQFQLEEGKRNTEQLVAQINELEQEVQVLQRYNKLEKKRKALESAILKVH